MNVTSARLLAVLMAGAAAVALDASRLSAQTRQKPPVVQPQEPEPDYTEEEYDAYEKAVQEKDLDKQGPALIAYMEKWPKSKLQPYIVTAYQTMLYQLHKNENSAKLLPAAEAWLKYFPNDLATINYVAGAAAKLNQDAKFIEFGLKVYAAKPSADYAYYVAQSYRKLFDEAKYQEWLQKTMAYPEYAGRFDLLMEFVDKHAKAKDFTKAADYAYQALKSMDAAKRPDSTPEAKWNDAVRGARRGCYYIIGLAHYEKEKYAETIAQMEKALALDRRFDLAYFYIGLSQWKLNKIENEDAPLSFAKAYLLKGEVADQAKQYLEKIYKALHNDTLMNVHKVYDRAKEELGAGRSSG